MTSSKKKRMSMLDSLAAAGAPSASPAPSMMATNRALRSARDAVDGHHVWELDPASILDDRPRDRLDDADVYDLRDAIEANGQTVPILVRRHPSKADQYLLVYGRRRLAAIRGSDKVTKVRALVAHMDDRSAVQAQISENMARRDLSYIEKALFAQELVQSGFGNQTQVAEVLTVTKSAISMAFAVVDAIGPDLIRAIGPAHGIGRPRWEALARDLADTGADPDRLIAIAEETHDKAAVDAVTEDLHAALPDPSVQAFEAVLATLEAPAKRARPAVQKPSARPARPRPLTVAGQVGGNFKRTAKGVTINIEDGAFADWIEGEVQTVFEDLHARFLARGED